MEKREIKKVLFYTHIPRFFRTTLIGYLYEIAQSYPTILLSEDLDSELSQIIRNKKLFPKIEQIIPLRQYTGKKENLLAKNRYLRDTVKKAVFDHKPDMVISVSDTHSLAELYLMRFAKQVNSVNIAVQCTNVVDINSLSKSVDLINAYLRFPSFFPLPLRMFLVKVRKYYGHFLYYYLLPVLVGERPFFGKSSYILRAGNSGMRDADFQVVFSKRDYETFLSDGVPTEKIHILCHPLKRKERIFFEDNLFKDEGGESGQNTAVLLLPSDEIGFKKSDFRLISKDERLKKRIEIIREVASRLKGWNILIKTHPNVKNLEKVKEDFESISESVRIGDPSEPVEKSIKNSRLIIGLPKSITTVLFSSSLLYPEKTILSIDFDKELLGDFYKNFEGVEYVDSEEEFVKILEAVKNNKYKKNIIKKKTEVCKEEHRNFKDLADYLFNKKKNLASSDRAV